MASLTVVSEGNEQKHALGASVVTVGRGLECGIRLKDVRVSRQHCQILRTATGYECVDLKSGNGTFINGVQISRQVLRSDDNIQVGSTLMVFRDAAAAAVASAPATARTPLQAAAPGTSRIPVTSAMRKADPDTAPTQKATLRLGRGTASSVRGGTTRGMQSAMAGARRKRTSPVIIIGGIVVLAAIVLGVIFLRGEDEGKKRRGAAPPEFRGVQEELNRKYFLEDNAGKADWSGAIRECREFLEKNRELSDGTRGRVDDEIRDLNRRAGEEVDALRLRAKRAVEEGRVKEAAEDLKQQKPRFENTESRDALEKLIQETGK